MIAPFIKSKSSVSLIMMDVIVALIPLAVVAWWAFGVQSLTVMGAAVASCVIADLAFSAIFLNKKSLVPDGSGVLTGLLLSFTISPLTPWYVVVFGGASAVLFGKVLWGGTGKNRFNPALVGREFMVAFFPAVMKGGSIWNTSFSAVNAKVEWFSFYSQSLSADVNKLFFNSSGALGEYSPLALVLMGFYLIWRKRISWHIPVVFFLTFSCLAAIFPDAIARFSIGGLLLGGIYMATDMPTSPTHQNGKIFYGFMLGIVVALLIFGRVSFAYMSFGILILNGFSPGINETLRTAPWGHNTELRSKLNSILRLTALILATTMAVVGLNFMNLTYLMVYIFAAYVMARYYYQAQYKISQPF